MIHNKHKMQHDMPMEHQAEHSCHEDGAPGMSHGSARDFLNRFFIVTALLVPMILLNDKVSNMLGLNIGIPSMWVSFALATVIFGFALVFFQHAWMEIQMRKPGMMVLVALAVASGYIFSVVAVFVPSIDTSFFLEISTLIWVLLFGHYLEAKSSAAAGNALQEVAKLLPKQALVIHQDGTEEYKDISELQVGDIVKIKPGEKVPADGVVLTGDGHVDESLISGESKPVSKGVGAELVAGSIVGDTTYTIELTRVGEHSTVGQIQTLILEAQSTKPRSQKLADKAAAVLTFVALAVAIATVLVWMIILGKPLVFAVTLAITVLVIACPHALGLAIPTVTTISTSLATKNGFFIKDLSKIETIQKADTVVFDKTGTLTEGVFALQKFKVYSQDYTEDELLRITASLEQDSSHMIAGAIVAAASNKGLQLSEVKEFKNHAGRGVSGTVDGAEYFIGNAAILQELGLAPKANQETGTLVYIATKGAVLGVLLLEDAIKEGAQSAVTRLKDLGIKVVMLTGDNDSVAAAVAAKLGIDTYYADVLPQDKYKYVKELQQAGDTVIMVGDGVNDAPALTQADAGVAIGAGTDVAVESGDVVLTRNNPKDIARLVVLSRAVYKKMKQNLVWALGYNIIAIPAAAGAFSVFGFILRPEIGALVMSLSTVIVVANAMQLKRLKL